MTLGGAMPSGATSIEKERWESKKIELKDVSSKIPNGSILYIGSAGSTPDTTLKALVDDHDLANIQIIQPFPSEQLPHQREGVDRFRSSSYWNMKNAGYFQSNDGTGSEGLQDYTPVSVVDIPRLLEEKTLHVDICIIKVTPPHKGFVSLGVGIECTPAFLAHCKTVIAEVTDYMPWTEGNTKIKTSQIDWWIDLSKPLPTTSEIWPDFFRSPPWPQDVQDKIGRNVLKLIPDGACLRLGIRPICQCVVPFLKERKDLGLHTELLTEELYHLLEEGVFTNEKKTIDRGRSIVSQAHGSQELYRFCDRNPVIEFHPASYVCLPQVLGKIDNLISVVAGLKVDVTGQVAIDSIAHKTYGGIWSDVESIRGARFSKGGKPIVIIPSRGIKGKSNIEFELPAGTGVAITRSDVEYIITEFGTAYLYGKSIRERCLSLINIAHPNFRPGLLEQAKKKRYISQSQPGKFSATEYPAELERIHITKKNLKVLVRPIKAVDEDILRNFFHKLSDHSVYLRYFRRLKSMPQRILQKTADVDYTKDMTMVVLSPPDSPQQELVAIGQWVNDPRGGSPEIAFQVRDDWQGEGLGSYLFKSLISIAKQCGLEKLKADVLSDNTGMNAVFKKGTIPFTKRSEFGVITYTFDLKANET